MKIVNRTDKKTIVQFRQFHRPENGGNMELTSSKTITIHDAELIDELYNLIIKEVGLRENRERQAD